jgi:hypothetical protein
VQVSGVFIHPIKSGAAIAADAWPLDAFGLAHDREYMVVDERGTYLTQREEPRLALVTGAIGEALTVSTPSGSARAVPGGRIEVTVWEHTGPALDCGDEVAELLSAHLERPCRMVRTPADHRRPTEFGAGQVGFADGYPLLITAESSLADLNTRLPVPLPMNRFRPNIVIAGCPPFDEDQWLQIQVGAVTIDVVKPCARCAITRVDQATGLRGDGEPLRTLGTFRKAKGGVMFGQNGIHRTTGTLHVGDPVRVAVRRP